MDNFETTSQPAPSASDAASQPAPSSPIGQHAPSLERTTDQIRAEQTQAILELTGNMLAALTQGFSYRSAQAVCDLLLPATDAVAIVITSTDQIMGASGQVIENNTVGGPIQSAATFSVLEDGAMKVIRSSSEIGFPFKPPRINAAIIVPLLRGGDIIGSLKFYYSNAEFLTETQQAIARGFGEVLSSQLDATALEEQRLEAASLELKMLQSQINPHFLFNTINTIAAFVRTDPVHARELLREFATFYRRSLEDSSDLISLKRELEQTKRYLSFETARFGDDRLQFDTDIPENISEFLVPSFLVQPLAENAVQHGMPSEGTLHIHVSARRMKDALIITIEDDGIGMSSDALERVQNYQEEGKGLGLAMRNINDRISGYYGPGSHMHINSTKGKGTSVELYLHNACRID